MFPKVYVDVVHLSSESEKERRVGTVQEEGGQ